MAMVEDAHVLKLPAAGAAGGPDHTERPFASSSSMQPGLIAVDLGVTASGPALCCNLAASIFLISHRPFD
jgi:hypothetical protein